jgi:hypothetical protein
MKRLAVGLAASAAATLLTTQSAWAQNTISVSASASGASVVVHVSGSADACTGYLCTAQSADVELVPYSPYADTCIQPSHPQSSTPLSTTGASFDFTTTIPADAGQTYMVWGYIQHTQYGFATVFGASQPATVTLAPGACPAGTPLALNLRAPANIAYGRDATVPVVNNSSQTPASATLAMQSTSDATPFYSYNFTKSDLDAGELDFDIQLYRGDSPTRITLTDQQGESDSSTIQCIEQVSALVTATPGNTPGAHLNDSLDDDPNGVGISFSALGGCALTRTMPEQITVRGSGANATLSTRDECSDHSWRVSGHIPGVYSTRRLQTSGSMVEFHDAGNLNRDYRLTVKVGDRIIHRGWLHSAYFNQPAQRVFQGTDAFVNYCIDQSKTIHSYHLSLFCWRPGNTQRFLVLD